MRRNANMPDWRADPVLADVENRGEAGRQSATGARRLAEMPTPATTARLVKLDQGLYALDIGETRGPAGGGGRTVRPALPITAPPSPETCPPAIRSRSIAYRPRPWPPCPTH